VKSNLAAPLRIKDRAFKVAEWLLLRTWRRGYLSLRYRRHFGRWPNLREPRRFTERLLLYKLSTRGDPRLPRLADKVLVKDHVARRVGAQHVVATLWQGTQLPPRAERNWPPPFVIKSTHASMQYVFVGVGEVPDWTMIEDKADLWLSQTYEFGERQLEWHYKHIRPRLIVEPMLGDGRTPPVDYKFGVFHGRVKLIQVDEGRGGEQTRWLMSREWEPLPFNIRYPRGTTEPPRPAGLNEMIRIAERLGNEFEYVRVDLYNIAGRIYFGEMTFFPGAGLTYFDPPEGDYAMGEFWTREDLPVHCPEAASFVRVSASAS
jgi:hypothetical protein